METVNYIKYLPNNAIFKFSQPVCEKFVNNSKEYVYVTEKEYRIYLQLLGTLSIMKM